MVDLVPGALGTIQRTAVQVVQGRWRGGRTVGDAVSGCGGDAQRGLAKRDRRRRRSDAPAKEEKEGSKGLHHAGPKKDSARIISPNKTSLRLKTGLQISGDKKSYMDPLKTSKYQPLKRLFIKAKRIKETQREKFPFNQLQPNGKQH